MNTTWVVVADEAMARILRWRPEENTLEPVAQLTDPAAHAKEADLRRDAQGRRGSTVTSSAGIDESHQEATRFARELVQHLDEARRQGHFDALRVVAAPRFLGLLRKAYPTALAACVHSEIDKDLVHASDQEVALRLFTR